MTDDELIAALRHMRDCAHQGIYERQVELELAVEPLASHAADRLEALIASRAQSVTDAARKLIEHWDDKGGKEERGSYEGVEYWSPSARMIDTQFVVDLRAALEAAQLPRISAGTYQQRLVANIQDHLATVRVSISIPPRHLRDIRLRQLTHCSVLRGRRGRGGSRQG